MNGEISRKDDRRLGGLRRFAVAITVFNLLGHTWFGFEQSWLQPLTALATAYALEILLEMIDARVQGRPERFRGGTVALVDFLLSAHITALSVAMLLYANERLLPLVFATAVAIGSKAVLRAPLGRARRHFLNPSNAGISLTLLLFPWVGISPPYHFTENLDGAADWILPGIIILSGTFLNARFTRRIPVVATWLAAFVAQAGLRSILFGTPWVAALLPMTGVAFLLFTFYMITDPVTSPSEPRAQVVFAAAVAAAYGVLTGLHVVFGLFFALTLVCALRGARLWALAWAEAAERRRKAVRVPALAPAIVGTQAGTVRALAEVEK